MPFTVTREQPNGKLYIRRQPDGEHAWTADKRCATPLTDTEAEAIAGEINRFASTPAHVEGLKRDEAAT
jgi:hypothetical protein